MRIISAHASERQNKRPPLPKHKNQIPYKNKQKINRLRTISQTTDNITKSLTISESLNGLGMQGIHSLNGPHTTALKYNGLVVMFMKPA